MRYDKDVNPEVHRACKEFAAYLRHEYYFPVRIEVHMVAKKKVVAMDGDKCYGILWRADDDYTIKPSIRVATGDYSEICEKVGQDRALTGILRTIAHELTHYFQWVNGLQLTQIGEERQAKKYEDYILWDYAETRDHP